MTKEISPALLAAIDTVLGTSAESDEFKRRLRKLIEHAVFDTAYDDRDVREVIDLVRLIGEGED